MRRIILPLLLVAAIKSFSGPASKDSNVVISSAAESYRFIIGKSKEINVRQESKTVYQSVNFRTAIPVVEFYDDITSIEDVRISVSGKIAKNITPKYEYYSQDNIFYSDAKLCYFQLPLEKKGSESEVFFKKNITDPRYFTSVFLTDAFPVALKTVTITIPRTVKVELREFNFEGQDIKKASVFDAGADADIITYTVRNLRAREQERNSPGPSYTEPHIFVMTKYADLGGQRVTYFNTLDDQYGWYRSLTKDLANNPPAVKQKALDLTKDLPNDMDKIKRIFYWMHDNIRYIAFENGIAGFRPEKSEVVLQKKYGDCKGMAHLTREMLRSLGFDARLCWIGTNHLAYDYSTPSIAVDNHMICALIYKGKTYFLDATENYIGFNEYAERIQGRQVLIEDGDKYISVKVPVTDYHQNTLTEKFVLSLNGTSLQGEGSKVWAGEEKSSVFTQIKQVKSGNLQQALQRHLSGAGNHTVVSSLETTDLGNYDQPLKVTYKLANDKAITAFGDDLYVDLDFNKDFSGFTFDLKEREHDYWFDYKTDMEVETELALPADYRISAMPQPVNVMNDDYEFATSLTEKNNKLFYKKKILIKNPRLLRSKFEQWNQDIRKLNSFYNEQIVLSKK